MPFYLHINGETAGPLEEAEVRERLASGQITGDTPCCLAGDTAWSTAAAVLDLPAPPPPPAPTPASRLQFQPQGASSPHRPAAQQLPSLDRPADTFKPAFDPTSFDCRLTNIVILPAFLVLAFLFNLTPLSFLLAGFHIWVHEFGHATVAWLGGFKALPLPFGWASISDERSVIVYLALLFLLGVFLVTGWRERKLWPVAIAGVLIPLQAWMTWFVSEYHIRKWITFAGVGGEFYLNALLMALFFVRMPEKFRWSFCRYVFLFIGATGFLKSFLLWWRIRRGEEPVPYGSMIHGEGDEGGDMNQLRDVFDWSEPTIISTYWHLSLACLAVLLVVYVIFASGLGSWMRLRLNSLLRFDDAGHYED